MTYCCKTTSSSKVVYKCLETFHLLFVNKKRVFKTRQGEYISVGKNSLKGMALLARRLMTAASSTE